jgi:hypothetical protein
LRGLALSAIATSVAAFGRFGWGLASLPGRPEDEVNQPTWAGGQATITWLRVVTPEGLLLEADCVSAPLPERGPAVVGVAFVLPEHALDEVTPARVTPRFQCYQSVAEAESAGALPLAKVEVRTSSGSKQRPWQWCVPLLDAAATVETREAAKVLLGVISQAGKATSARPGFEWQAVTASLRIATDLTPKTPFHGFVLELRRALSILVALVLACGEGGALESAKVLEGTLAKPPVPEPELLAKWLEDLAAPLQPDGALMTWLCGRGAKRVRLPGYPKAVGIERRLERFDVKGATEIEIRLKMNDPWTPLVEASIDDAPVKRLELRFAPSGFEAVIKLSEAARHLNLVLPAQGEAQVFEAVRGQVGQA